MSKFITGKSLEDAVYNIIWEAKTDLVIVSPYIKLDAYFKKLFDKHLSNPKIRMTIIFGKNEGQVVKSFNKSDIEYFKQFLNISIVYVPNLHAKYYANENTGVLTSINLYDYSFINNIEFGVLYENKFINRVSNNTDYEAWDQCGEIAEKNEIVYIKRPIFQSKLFSKDYKSSKVLLDRVEELYNCQILIKGKYRLSNFKEDLDFDKEFNIRPDREEIEKSPKKIHIERENSNSIKTGYCIRTGAAIPFNPEKPLSYQAYQSWSTYSNLDYQENFCHFSGEPSNGETSVRRPFLYKNWKKAQLLIKTQ